MDPGDPVRELVLVERAVVRLDLAAGGGQQRGRIGVDVLQQQDVDLVVSERGHGPDGAPCARDRRTRVAARARSDPREPGGSRRPVGEDGRVPVDVPLVRP